MKEIGLGVGLTFYGVTTGGIPVITFYLRTRAGDRIRTRGGDLLRTRH